MSQAAAILLKHTHRALGMWLVALVCLVISSVVWLPVVGGFLIASDPLQHADAIVPLAGDRYRADYAAGLLKHGYADQLVITDMWLQWEGVYDKPTTYAHQIERQVIKDGVAPEHIMFAPGTAGTTYGEALLLRAFAQQQGFHSLIVVTSTFHTHRSQLIFRDVFRDSTTKIIVRPVEPDWYSAAHWWQTAQGCQITVEQYLKLALYLLGYHRFWY